MKKYLNRFGKRLSGRHAQYIARYLNNSTNCWVCRRRDVSPLYFMYGGDPTCNPRGKYTLEECFTYDNYLECWKSEGTFALSREGYYHGKPLSPAYIVRKARDRHQTDQAYA